MSFGSADGSCSIAHFRPHPSAGVIRPDCCSAQTDGSRRRLIQAGPAHPLTPRAHSVMMEVN